jgi:hypothetical protein
MTIIHLISDLWMIKKNNKTADSRLKGQKIRYYLSLWIFILRVLKL